MFRPPILPRSPEFRRSCRIRRRKFVSRPHAAGTADASIRANAEGGGPRRAAINNRLYGESEVCTTLPAKKVLHAVNARALCLRALGARFDLRPFTARRPGMCE